jgi:hypothetical protein
LQYILNTAISSGLHSVCNCYNLFILCLLFKKIAFIYFPDCSTIPEPGKLRRFETYQDLTSLSDDFDLFGSADTIDDIISINNNNDGPFLAAIENQETEEPIQSPPLETLVKHKRRHRYIGGCIRRIGKSIRETFQSLKCW